MPSLTTFLKHFAKCFTLFNKLSEYGRIYLHFIRGAYYETDRFYMFIPHALTELILLLFWLIRQSIRDLLHLLLLTMTLPWELKEALLACENVNKTGHGLEVIPG